jgi:hypothetical protein
LQAYERFAQNRALNHFVYNFTFTINTNNYLLAFDQKLEVPAISTEEFTAIGDVGMTTATYVVNFSEELMALSVAGLSDSAAFPHSVNKYRSFPLL